MPILFTHLISGVLAVGVLGLLCRRTLIHPLFYLWGVFAFLLPDLNYLPIWHPCMAGEILPSTWEDLFTGLFTPHPPFLLHCWAYPTIIAALTAVTYRGGWRGWKYLAVLALGWAVHLTMDGITLT